MVYMAVATDLTSDGLMIGVGSAVGKQLGFLLAATQAIAKIPAVSLPSEARLISKI